MLHENGNHGRAIDYWYASMVHHLTTFITGTVMWIPHIDMKRKLLINTGSQNRHGGHVNIYQAVVGFLCPYVLCLPNIHAHVDAAPCINGMVHIWRTTLLGAH